MRWHALFIKLRLGCQIKKNVKRVHAVTVWLRYLYYNIKYQNIKQKNCK